MTSQSTYLDFVISTSGRYFPTLLSTQGDLFVSSMILTPARFTQKIAPFVFSDPIPMI